MTAAQFETLETPEAEAILRWRFEVLVKAGYDPGSALILASHLEVDLHEAGLLLERGCPPEVAVQIVL
jgi:ketol-acid reductoisomerase